MTKSNLSTFLLIANVKDNQLVYAFPEGQSAISNLTGVKLPVTKVDSQTKSRLRQRLINS